MPNADHGDPARVAPDQQGPKAPNPHGHAFGKPYIDGYATCHFCGVMENAKEAAQDCPDRYDANPSIEELL